MALRVFRVLPLWRPSALDLDFHLPHPLSLSLSFPFSTLMTGADWRVSPQLAWATVGFLVFVHFSFSLCVFVWECVCAHVDVGSRIVTASSLFTTHHQGARGWFMSNFDINERSPVSVHLVFVSFQSPSSCLTISCTALFILFNAVELINLAV